MDNETKRVAVIGIALLAVIGAVLASEEYQIRKQVKYCKEVAIVALSGYVQTDEYTTAVQRLTISLNAGLREVNGERGYEFDRLLASFQIEDRFTVQKYQECQARLRSGK